MRHQRIANGSARAGDEIHCFFGKARFVEYVNEFGRDGRRVACGLQNHSIAGYHGRDNQTSHDRRGEIPGRNNHTDA